jgi:hypothetical protein
MNVPASCDLVFSYGGFQSVFLQCKGLLFANRLTHMVDMDFKVWKEYLITEVLCRKGRSARHAKC